MNDRPGAFQRLQELENEYIRLSGLSSLLLGSLSLITAISTVAWLQIFPSTRIPTTLFAMAWSCVFAISFVVAACWHWEILQKKNLSFRSPETRMIFAALLPAIFAGGVVTFSFVKLNGDARFLSAFWMIFYGLMLLSTSSFFPGVITRLGWGTLILGCGFCLYWFTSLDSQIPLDSYRSGVATASISMGLGFGVLQFVYGMMTLKKAPRTDSTCLNI